jgi:phosphoribosylaminoimidazolecarboxamide formyltransferase/IMP cyclohydrolase
VFASGYDVVALEIHTQKQNVRILDNSERRRVPLGEHDIRRVRGGILVQDRDSESELREEMSVVTEMRPTEDQWGELLFAWRVCKHVRSNAIVMTKNLGTVGIGAGQMSRVDSVRIAIEKAQSPLDGTVMASDAYFPFADGPQAAIDAGVRAIIQPGGSKRDPEVVEACERAGVPMVFTSRRHFRH